mmetsp:Transcript_51495/g.111833  ORF Transcript_51495/g.111833 Transcript_51495/m.111833 type:complete len:161 (-) Transcript_51495:197-679(-)
MVDNYVWRPRSVEDTIDAGVHPAVAAMRRQAAKGGRSVEDVMSGRKVVHIIHQTKAPGLDMNKLGSDPSYNPSNFFKQAGKLGVNPMRELMLSGKDGPTMPDEGKKSKSKKDSKKKKDKKSKKDKSKKKKKDKKEKKAAASSDESSEADDALLKRYNKSA